MAARVQTLKSIFTADTAQAEAGFRRMHGETARLQSSTKGFGQVADGVFDGLGVNIAQFAGPVGIGLAVAGMGKMALSMEQMREESAQLEARFIAFTGSAGRADAVFRALDRTLGNALSKDQMMAAAAQLMGLGLAQTAQEAATLTEQALILGIDIDTLAKALETGRASGLVPFGIAVSDVKERAQELQKANAELTATEAQAIAVKEQLAQKAAAVEAAGGRAATQVQELQNAWDTLKDTAADRVELQVVLKLLTEAVSNTAHWMSPEGEAEQAYAQAFEQYRAAVERVNKAQADLGQWYANITPLARQNYENKLAEAQAAEALAEASYRAATAAYNEARGTDALASSAAAAQEPIAGVGDAVEGVNGVLSDSDKYWQAWAGFAENAALRASRAAWAARSAMGQVTDGTVTGTFTEPSKTRWGLYGEWGRNFVQSPTSEDPVKAWVERQKAANREVATHAKTEWQREMEQATRDFQGEFKTAMDGAIADSRGLKDLLGGSNPNAPGKNGFAEDIFRLQAFITDGSWSETAAKHGLDQAGATDVIRKFQSGQWDESVQKILNMDQLKAQIKQQQVAKAMMDQLAADLAAETQGDPKLIKAMLGMGGGSDSAPGSGGTAAAGLDMSGFTAGFLAGLDRELAANAADIEARGETAGDKFGQGFVKRLAAGPYLREAIFKLVDQRFVENLE